MALVLRSAAGEERRKKRRTGSVITRLHGIWEERFGKGRCKLSWLQAPNALIQLTNQLGLKKLHPEEGSVPKMSVIFFWDQDTIWVNLLGSFLVVFIQVVLCPASLFLSSIIKSSSYLSSSF